jgi:hypothetical protein
MAPWITKPARLTVRPVRSMSLPSASIFTRLAAVTSL